MEKLSMEEAIETVAGTYKYQKVIFMVLSLGQFALAFFIMGIPYIFPVFPMDCSVEICIVPEQFKNSGTAQMGLVGEENYKIGFVGTSYFVGMMCGAMIVNWFSDKYGRRFALKYCCIISIPLLLLAAFSWNVYVFCIASFGMGTMEIGMYVAGFILCTEIVEKKYRNWYSGLFFSIWGVAATVLSLLFMFGVPWRVTLLLAAFLMFLELLLTHYILESPRFLLAHTPLQAIEVLNHISLMNNAGIFSSQIQSTNSPIHPQSYFAFCGKATLFKFVVCAITWFNIILGYYGMVFIFPSFGANTYLVGIVMYIAETIATLTAAYFINAIGRKKTAIFSFLVSGASFFIIFLAQTMLHGNTAETFILAASGLARFAISAEFFMIYIYTAEVFPTGIRSMAFGICNTIGRFAGLLSSNLFAICSILGIKSALLLGIILLASAGLSFLLEETLGKDLDEDHRTIKKVEDGKKFENMIEVVEFA